MTKLSTVFQILSPYSNEFEIKYTNKTFLEKRKKKKVKTKYHRKNFCVVKKSTKKLFSQQRASVS